MEISSVNFIQLFRIRLLGFSQGPKRGRPILVQRHIYSKEGGEGGGQEKKVPLENL
jgi:hypothetical protein